MTGCPSSHQCQNNYLQIRVKNSPTVLTSMSERNFCSVDSRVPRKIFNGLLVFGFLISLSSKRRHLSARVDRFMINSFSSSLMIPPATR